MALFSQVKTANEQETYINNNIKTNGTRSITGAMMNTAFITYVMRQQPNAEYDTTRTYYAGQFCIKDTSLYYCKATTNGVFDASDWKKVQIDTTQIIYSTGGNNVMGQPLVVMGDTVRPLPRGTADGQMLRWNDAAKRWSKVDYFIIDSANSSFKNDGAFGGFGFNIASGPTSFISGGNSNNATNFGTFIGGGSGNTASGNNAVAFGNNNKSSQSNTVATGLGNIAKWGNQLVTGRYNDTTTVDHFAVGVGKQNTQRATAFRIGQDSGVYMPLLPSATTPTTLYYNTTTKEVSYGVLTATNNTDTASSANVGAIRYTYDTNYSRMEMVMQTDASTYQWVIIKENTW